MKSAVLTSLFTLALGAARAAQADPASADAAPCAEIAAAVDLQSLPLDDRRVFCQFTKDLIAGGCCQGSLHDCLKAHPTCARAQVLAELGKGVISTGATEEGAAAAGTAYEDGFQQSKRAFLDTSKVPCRGAKDGVTLAEFSDFDCPHCAAAAPILDKLVSKDPGLRFCSFAFPLPGHAYSTLAAAAALYADSQGKYWPMSAALFASQDDREGLDEQGYKAQLAKVGKKIGLDPAALLKALDPSGPFMDKVKDEQVLGISLLLQGTPSFFVEGRAVSNLPLKFLAIAAQDERDSKGKK